MSWLNTHRRKQGASIKDSHALSNVNFANISFNDSLAHQVVQIEGEYYDTRFIIKREYNVSSKYEAEMLIFRPFTEVFRGQMAEFRNRHWLIYNVDTGELAPKAYIRMCNKTLEFDNGNQYHCVVDTNIREYQSIKDMSRLNLMSNIMKIMVASNEDTWQIRETDRFVIDGLAWEVQGVDKVAYTNNKEGVVEFVVNHVPLNEEEKNEIEASEDVSDSVYSLKIIGDDEVAINTEFDYSTELYKDGLLIDESDYIISWDVDIGNISSDGRLVAPNKECTVSVSAIYQYIDSNNEFVNVSTNKDVAIFKEDWGWG